MFAEARASVVSSSSKDKIRRPAPDTTKSEDGGDAKSGGSSPVMTGDKTEASDLQRRARRTFNRYKQLDPSVVMQLKRQEQQKQSQLVQEELKHSQISSQILDMRLQTQTKLQNLRVLERQLSNQAGALLAALQREEGRANKVAATVKGIRSTRKQLLAKITTPRWEVKHHYHIHPQPHVMDVGEMLPGNLRLYAQARRTTLFQKALIYSLNRARTARNSASETIKGVYNQLREVRKDMKEMEKLMETMRKNQHLFPEDISAREKDMRAERKAARENGHGPGGGVAARAAPQAIRMKYFQMLNLAPSAKTAAVPIKTGSASAASGSGSASPGPEADDKLTAPSSPPLERAGSPGSPTSSAIMPSPPFSSAASLSESINKDKERDREAREAAKAAAAEKEKEKEGKNSEKKDKDKDKDKFAVEGTTTTTDTPPTLSADLEWKSMLSLLKELNHQQSSRKKAAEELKFVQDCQNEFKKGISSLPALKLSLGRKKSRSFAGGDEAATTAAAVGASARSREGSLLQQQQQQQPGTPSTPSGVSPLGSVSPRDMKDIKERSPSLSASVSGQSAGSGGSSPRSPATPPSATATTPNATVAGSAGSVSPTTATTTTATTTTATGLGPRVPSFKELQAAALAAEEKQKMEEHEDDEDYDETEEEENKDSSKTQLAKDAEALAEELGVSIPMPIANTAKTGKREPVLAGSPDSAVDRDDFSPDISSSPPVHALAAHPPTQTASAVTTATVSASGRLLGLGIGPQTSHNASPRSVAHAHSSRAGPLSPLSPPSASTSPSAAASPAAAPAPSTASAGVSLLSGRLREKQSSGSFRDSSS